MLFLDLQPWGCRRGEELPYLFPQVNAQSCQGCCLLAKTHSRKTKERVLEMFPGPRKMCQEAKMMVHGLV